MRRPTRKLVSHCGAALAALVGVVLAGGLAPPAGAQLEGLDHLLAAQVDDTCQRIGATLGSVSVERCRTSGLYPAGGWSVEGVPILLKEYPPLPTRQPLGRVLLIGGIHGDEYSAVSIVFHWMETLDRFHSGLFHWRIVPLVNPDGLLHQPTAQRGNANGVDLNRNFPSPDWETEAPRHWVEETGSNPRRYPGSGPLSEPETRWLVGEVERFRPDIIVSVHAPYSIVDFDGPDEPPHRLGPLRLRLLGTYPGSLGRWAGVHGDVPVVTVELPSAGVLPSPAEQNQIWVDLVRWLRERLSDAGTVTAGDE